MRGCRCAALSASSVAPCTSDSGSVSGFGWWWGLLLDRVLCRGGCRLRRGGEAGCCFRGVCLGETVGCRGAPPRRQLWESPCDLDGADY